MQALKTLESFVKDYPVAFAQIGPSFWGDGMYPPDDAVYYPLYTKCCELDLPLSCNTGLPGPPIPGEVQNPMYLDRVCVRFPEPSIPSRTISFPRAGIELGVSLA